jgi:hypothetical protein
LGGTIELDTEYDSGVPGCPGARFVINLNAKPLFDQVEDNDNIASSNASLSGNVVMELPKELKVLFVDDDVSTSPVKLFLLIVATPVLT